ncbi:DUF3493 domain-containing protein [Phormidium pseudopriestleyi FRX01]|uniref:DUF3493 domain-containing protein n=1 Tax=Phormidium pseudopriestleyi FRX01 TaxID=1759528 RepID=A0ABS3FVD0_9CYAN|nr:DUF3493 domain-containing protein [Phormidium pseudopriestleyi]MBO0350307.1 DUF3493 domain-containing protein [Phormidium pseudopriestleyi FRX01]
MADQTPDSPTGSSRPPSGPSRPRGKQSLPPEKYARLRAEAAAPYKGLRKFVYVVCGASGGIGAFVFLAQLLAGREVGAALPNFALQLGVVALMVWLFRLEKAD